MANIDFGGVKEEVTTRDEFSLEKAREVLKDEVIGDGLDIMVVRELIGGIYFGEPRGEGVDENGERYAYNTMVYKESEVKRIVKLAFEIARKRGIDRLLR